MAFAFPGPLYAIADPTGAPQRSPLELVEAIVAAGIPLVQLRVKAASTRALVELGRAARVITDRAGAQLIINDRADVARLVDAAGVHVGQDDLPPEAARAIVGPNKIVGFSTHTADQVRAAEQSAAISYIAFGPIFATRSKQRPDPEQGLEALRFVRGLTARPLVAIGGITADTVGSVLHVGADAVAVIGAIARTTDPQASARALQERARAATDRQGYRRS